MILLKGKQWTLHWRECQFNLHFSAGCDRPGRIPSRTSVDFVRSISAVVRFSLLRCYHTEAEMLVDKAIADSLFVCWSVFSANRTIQRPKIREAQQRHDNPEDTRHCSSPADVWTAAQEMLDTTMLPKDYLVFGWCLHRVTGNVLDTHSLEGSMDICRCFSQWRKTHVINGQTDPFSGQQIVTRINMISNWLIESEGEAQTRTDCSLPRVSAVNVKNSTGISLNLCRIDQSYEYKWNLPIGTNATCADSSGWFSVLTDNFNVWTSTTESILA